MPADRCEQSERRLVVARGFPTGSSGEPLEGETLAGFQDHHNPSSINFSFSSLLPSAVL